MWERERKNWNKAEMKKRKAADKKGRRREERRRSSEDEGALAAGKDSKWRENGEKRSRKNEGREKNCYLRE